MKLLVVAAILGVCLADRLDNKYLPPRGNQGAGASSGFGQGTPNFGHGGGNFGLGGGNFGQQGGFGQQSGFGHGQAGSGFGHSAGGFGHSGGASQGAYNQGGFGGANAYAGQSHSNPADVNAQILRSNSEVTAEGFSYDFETSNGIRADASGVATNGVQSHGSFAYKGDDGQDYSITYTADENGYQPQGAHLPTPPPIPEAILKSLEQNARDEAAGISDDGSYHGEGAGASGAYSGNGGYSGGNSGYSGANSGYSGPNAGYSGANAGYSGAKTGYSGAGNFGQGNFGSASSGFGQKSFGGAAASRQYLAPNAGPRGSGSGNFNSQTGYRY